MKCWHGVLEPEELFQTVNYYAMDDALDILGHEKEELLPSESLEPESTRVLDPEELSIVNQGFKKRGTSLPRIQEDVWRSTESNSAIESGTSSLSSLVIDIFEDMKASMHKYTSASDLATSSLKLLRGERNINLHTSKELRASSRTRMRDMPISRETSTKPHRVEKSKGSSVSVASQKQRSAGSGEINSSSSPKPPKIFDRVKQIPASTKKASLVAHVVKDGKPASTKKAFSVANVVKDGKPESRVGSGINNPNGATNQARYSKLHSSRALPGTSKQNVCQPAVHVRPTHSAQIEEEQNASVAEHAKKDTIKNCSTMTFKDENDLPCKTCCKDRLGTEKVGSKDDEAADFVIRTKAENEGTKGSARNNKGRKHVESTLQRPLKKSLNKYETPKL
ncbi:hypothetical protein FEM48_Zijuj03G0084500 [Ziziphus jujuba var. spinosa]|uniref:Uncharacterized protein n=1 Tax=Ziziphus jujuba var. spinosa TaxID=714518 RepID=A0A978VP87_ZIZJJ|nr:hypothetical protein FEM48_Zijuj03G0084500 [Ziziphus jujuba var. spinosa]